MTEAKSRGLYAVSDAKTGRNRPCADWYILLASKPIVHPYTEARIRRFAVGLLAIAALAAAGYLLTRRRPTLAAVPGGKEFRPVDDLYAAGL